MSIKEKQKMNDHAKQIYIWVRQAGGTHNEAMQASFDYIAGVVFRMTAGPK